MPVVVQCFHCAHVLELDDGFRGGVCRCSQCGGLLQVPKGDGVATRGARPAAPIPRPDRKTAGSGGADIGISSGRLDPRNAPSGNYRGAADPELSSGRLSPQRPVKTGPPKVLPDDASQAITLDAGVQVRDTEKETPKAAPRHSRIFWGITLSLMVVLAVAAVIIELTGGFGN